MQAAAQWLLGLKLSDVSVVGMLFLIPTVAAFGLWKEWWVLGKYHAAQMKACDGKDATLKTAADTLAAQLLINERMKVRDEYQTADLARLAAEADRLRDQLSWRDDQRAERANRNGAGR